MKKITAIFITTLLLCMALTAGCSTQASSTATPTPLASKAPVRATIGPAATVDITLNDDTIYDESAFSIQIPKGAKLNKTGNYYCWVVQGSHYGVTVSITKNADSLKTTTYTGSKSNLYLFTSTISKSFSLNMESGYKKLTVDGKTAILLAGVFADDPLDKLEYYFVDTNVGSISIVVIKKQSDSSTATTAEMDKVATDIFSSIKIK